MHPGTLLEVFGALWRRGFSGVVFAHSGATHRVVYFDHGACVYADSDATRDSLTAMLCELHIVPPEDLELLTKRHTLHDQAEDELRLGQLLIDRGWMDHARLDALLVEHTKRRILASCQIVHGEFEVWERREAHDSISPRVLDLEPLHIMFTGVRRSYDLNALAIAFHELTMLCPVLSADFNTHTHSFPWSSETVTWVTALDGTTTLHALLQRQASDIMSTLTVLQVLRVTQLIAFQEPSQQPVLRVEISHGVPLRVEISEEPPLPLSAPSQAPLPTPSRSTAPLPATAHTSVPLPTPSRSAAPTPSLSRPAALTPTPSPSLLPTSATEELEPPLARVVASLSSPSLPVAPTPAPSRARPAMSRPFPQVFSRLPSPTSSSSDPRPSHSRQVPRVSPSSTAHQRHNTPPPSSSPSRSFAPQSSELQRLIEMHVERLHEEEDCVFLDIPSDSRSHQVRALAQLLVHELAPQNTQHLDPYIQQDCEKVLRRARIILARVEISQSRGIFGNSLHAPAPHTDPAESLHSQLSHTLPVETPPHAPSHTTPSPRARDQELWDALYSAMRNDNWGEGRNVLRALKTKGHKGADFESEVAWVAHNMPHIRRNIEPTDRLRRILKHVPKHFQSLYYLILISLDLGKKERAQRILHRTMAMYPNNARLIALRNELHRMQSRDHATPARFVWAKLLDRDGVESP